MGDAALIRRVWIELEPHLEEQGFELVEVEFGPARGRHVLRLFVDHASGVTLDDCACVSQLVGPVLDQADIIPGSYVLEVSSPGIDRPLRKPKDFERFQGEPVRIRTHSPVGGRRNFRGVLKGLEGDQVLVNCDDATYELHLENLAKTNLDR